MMWRGWSAASKLISGKTGAPPIAPLSSPDTCIKLFRSAAVLSRSNVRREERVRNFQSAGPFGPRCGPERPRSFWLGALLIGGRAHDKPVHFLDAPTVFDEVMGQPVEQFGMSWPLPHLAEIVGRGDEALAEMPLPDAIDHHACR